MDSKRVQDQRHNTDNTFTENKPASDDNEVNIPSVSRISRTVNIFHDSSNQTRNGKVRCVQKANSECYTRGNPHGQPVLAPNSQSLDS